MMYQVRQGDTDPPTGRLNASAAYRVINLSKVDTLHVRAGVLVARPREQTIKCGANRAKCSFFASGLIVVSLQHFQIYFKVYYVYL